MAPPRSYGLPWHLLYPISAIVLMAVPAFSSAASVYWVSTNTSTLQVRFASRDYCGYNATADAGLQYYSGLGCIYGGWSYDVSSEELGMFLPGAITNSLSRGAGLVPFCFAALVIATAFQAYTIRYSFLLVPAPHKDKLYTLVQIVFLSVTVVTLFSWMTFLVMVCICGSATDDRNLKLNGVAVWWGASTWLVLASATCQLAWMYEAVRWRFVENSKS